MSKAGRCLKGTPSTPRPREGQKFGSAGNVKYSPGDSGRVKPANLGKRVKGGKNA